MLNGRKSKWLGSFLLLLVLAAGPSLAKTDGGLQKPLLLADHITFDEKTNVVTATGHVEVAFGNQILRADQMTYDKNTEVVRANGHIALTQTSGEILYAKEMEMTSDMKEAFMNDVGILFPDDSRLAARDAQRFEGRYLITDRGVYSACLLCAKDPKAPPLWQIKGVRITHDSEEKKVIYRDATIEFGGAPLFYTPYFSHPDPSVKRQQGFLTPYVGHSQALGIMASDPYYLDLAPNSDLILRPTFSEEDKAQMAADWRYRFTNGSMEWSGSFAHTKFINENNIDKGYQWRGHLFGKTRFDLSDTWRAGSDVAFASDKSYMPRYRISSDDLLVNRAYAERFSGRNYAVGNMYYFQDMRPGITQKEPFVAPEVRYTAYGEPNQTLGGRWSFGSSLLVTTRERDTAPENQGPNTRRLSFDAGWERQIVSSAGFLTNVSLQTRADGYWADNVPYTEATTEETSFSKVQRIRSFAQSHLSVRYPFGRKGRGYRQIVEPIAVLSMAPRMKQETLFPNEDSLDVEFDETNLFSTNRFTGVDRLEGGARTAYGLRHAIITHGGSKLDMLGGQVFRTKKDMSFPNGSGLRNRFSDYVGRLGFFDPQLFDVNYSFRLAEDTGAFTRQQVLASAGTPVFRPTIRYIFSRETQASSTDSEKLEEGYIYLSSHFIKNWFLTASYSHAFKPEPGPRTSMLTFTYKDECFEGALAIERDHTVRTDVETGTSVIFRFFMKNIGGWESDGISTGGM